jgi:Tfp pilus assembly protein PilN
MINLLPEDLKYNHYFGYRNRKLMQSLVFLGIVVFSLALVYGYGYFALYKNRTEIEKSVAGKQSEIADLDKLNLQAQSLSDTINTASTILSRENKFSLFIQKIGSAMPTGAYLTKLSLATDQATRPFEIQAVIDSEEQATVLQKNLVASGVFAAADIEEVRTDKITDEKQGVVGSKKITTRILATIKKTDPPKQNTTLPQSFTP